MWSKKHQTLVCSSKPREEWKKRNEYRVNETKSKATEFINKVLCELWENGNVRNEEQRLKFDTILYDIYFKLKILCCVECKMNSDKNQIQGGYVIDKIGSAINGETIYLYQKNQKISIKCGDCI